jgi:acetyl-CoA carboxylase/biotin carboxylase 1
MAAVNGNKIKKTNGTVVPVMNGSTSYAAKHKLADHFIGGNKLENAAPSPVKDFVASHDGHTVITNVCTTPEKRPGVLS